MALNEGIAGSMAIIPYKNALEPLFAALSSEIAPNSAQPQQVATQPQPQPQNAYNDFRQAAAKRNDYCAEVSFWVSILMILVSFTGIIVGAIFFIFNYYLAAQGLKSNKKGKAIAAIIMSSVAIAIMVTMLIIKE